MIGLLVKAGMVAVWATGAQAEGSCEAYAEAMMVTAVGRDAGITRVEAITSAIQVDVERNGFAEVMTALISAVYDSNVRPEDAYVITLQECRKDGGW